MNISSIRQKFDFLIPAFRKGRSRLLLARVVWILLALTLAGMVVYSLTTQSSWINPDLPEVERIALAGAGFSPPHTARIWASWS